VFLVGVFRFGKGQLGHCDGSDSIAPIILNSVCFSEVP